MRCTYRFIFRIGPLRQFFFSSFFLFVGLGVLTMVSSNAFASTQNRAVNLVFSDVVAHEFHPLNEEDSFTGDRNLKKAGIADLDDTDWKVRLLAIRDLVRAGAPAVPQIIEGLHHENKHVRMVSAAALGVLKTKNAVPTLEKTAKEDPSSLVRSQAVIALGQINSSDSLPILQDILENDPSRDVKLQTELSIDQIQKQKGATPELLKAWQQLDTTHFESVKVGEKAFDFTLQDTDGKDWTLSEFQNDQWVVLVWIFANWCPVCHGEFRDLIAMKDEFAKENVQVYTIEQHDTYRGRVMLGRELEPSYWFAKEPFNEAYTQGIWWTHLLDRAGAVGAAYGADPMAFAVHAEYINRPSTVIIDPKGIVRLAYFGTYWGDRPTIHETLEMIRNEDFSFTHPKRLQVHASSE